MQSSQDESDILNIHASSKHVIRSQWKGRFTALDTAQSTTNTAQSTVVVSQYPHTSFSYNQNYQICFRECIYQQWEALCWPIRDGTKPPPPQKKKKKKNTTRPCTKQCRLVRGGTKKVTITCLYECTISRILEPVNIPRPISCYDEHEGGLAISFSGPARGNSVNQN